MVPRRQASKGSDILERVANGKVLAVAVSVLVFGFTFIASGMPTPGSKPPLSIGSADPADLSGAGLADNMVAIVDESPPPDEGLFYSVYRVVKGDTISEIAGRFGISPDSIITFNGITNARSLSIGKYLKVPSLNGILYSAKAGDTPDALAASYNISAERIKEINRLDDGSISVGRSLFLPDARLSSWALREISGDLFSWPLRGWITSWYGWRDDPFAGNRTFHTGIDIGSNTGIAVRAAMEGVVSATGYSTTSGNYVVIAHHSGYSSLYAHLSRIDVKAGRSVSKSTIIGAVGNTGYSTGPHLHFTVSKYGRTINPMTVLR